MKTMDKNAKMNEEYLNNLLTDAAKNHYKMLLIAEPSELEKHPELTNLKYELIRWVKENNGRQIDVYGIVSEILTQTESSVLASIEIGEKIDNIIEEESRTAKGPLIFDNASILFSKSIANIDAIRKFKYHSRIQPIIVFMPLKVNHEKKLATFGELYHEDYRRDMDISEIICVKLEELGL